jgi:signal transduction histidine kinase
MLPHMGNEVLGATVAQDVLESLLEGCQVVDVDYRYVFVNETVAKQGQREKDELLGRTMMECYPGIDGTPMFDVLRRCMKDRKHDRLENEFKFPDGSAGWFELRFVPVPQGVCILSLDITGQKRAVATLAKTEEQLRQAQKMEAIGRLAGSVAHDFNNVLSVVLSYSDFILADLKPNDPLRADVEQIEAAGRRAADLTRQLLAFSRQQALQPVVLDANQILVGTEKMLRRLLGADVALTMLISHGVWKIKADAGQIEQVMLNLAVNARDAMPTGGKLMIETKNVELDHEYARLHHEVVPGPYVMIAVTDTGVGMDKATQARVFEPFFTTKDTGRGTGLGLATVFGIVKQSGGHIWLYSEPGKGTTFKVYFPRAEGEVARPPTTNVPTSKRGNETVLLVEDDDQVRAVAVGILRRHGYRVLEAPNAGEAFMISEEHSATIHLLLTDVVLPRISGRQLAERLVAQRPKMRVLYMSGYTDDAVLQHGILESNVAYLQKPLTPDALARKVREVLDALVS